ncbi:CDP-glycerol glycerophosphotransferase family protein [Massilicoli timonensis]|uniref:CDP-glycerol glycerophosphotransferase family protein n=1 Tax=Massilicoli timonensis TaxID=2015901 RepID=UPI000C82A3E2|nr:CDP-glycerol glycerophosphotransferase family protein [Massilicoli timonensis]
MKIIKEIIIFFFSFIPLKNAILFESIPDFSDNSKDVFDEMIKRGINKKCKMIWLVSDKSKSFPVIKNVVYIDRKTFIHKIHFIYYRLKVKCIITCNECFKKLNKKQFSFFLTHGSPIKKIKGVYTISSDIDNFLVASNEFSEVTAYQHNMANSKAVALGYPRNDSFFIKRDLHSLFNIKFNKIIVWYPTFRQHKNGLKTGSSTVIPIIDDERNAITINDFARKNDILIVIKPHFSQDIKMFKKLNLKNIVFIDESFFTVHNINSYEFLGNCDALLTDYSSVYYDYTLCDKPIGAVWEDIEEYRDNPGFSINIDYYWAGAQKIYTVQDLMKFIENVSNGEDILKEERNRIKKLINYMSDNKNSERVVDFIISKNKWLEV